MNYKLEFQCEKADLVRGCNFIAAFAGRDLYEKDPKSGVKILREIPDEAQVTIRIEDGQPVLDLQNMKTGAWVRYRLQSTGPAPTVPHDQHKSFSAFFSAKSLRKVSEALREDKVDIIIADGYMTVEQFKLAVLDMGPTESQEIDEGGWEDVSPGAYDHIAKILTFLRTHPKTPYDHIVLGSRVLGMSRTLCAATGPANGDKDSYRVDIPEAALISRFVQKVGVVERVAVNRDRDDDISLVWLTGGAASIRIPVMGLLEHTSLNAASFRKDTPHDDETLSGIPTAEIDRKKLVSALRAMAATGNDFVTLDGRPDAPMILSTGDQTREYGQPDVRGKITIPTEHVVIRGGRFSIMVNSNSLKAALKLTDDELPILRCMKEGGMSHRGLVVLHEDGTTAVISPVIPE